MHDVFGDGHDYDWALEGEDAFEVETDRKDELQYADVRSLPRRSTKPLTYLSRSLSLLR